MRSSLRAIWRASSKRRSSFTDTLSLRIRSVSTPGEWSCIRGRSRSTLAGRRARGCRNGGSGRISRVQGCWVEGLGAVGGVDLLDEPDLSRSHRVRDRDDEQPGIQDMASSPWSTRGRRVRLLSIRHQDHPATIDNTTARLHMRRSRRVSYILASFAVTSATLTGEISPTRGVAARKRESFSVVGQRTLAPT